MARMNEKTKKYVGIAMLTALVVILQFLGSFIKFGPFSVSLVLIPIVLGASLYGTIAGGWLGFVFGVVVLLSGDAGAFLTINPWGTVATVLAKGTLAGVAAGLVNKLFNKKHPYIGVVSSAIICPIVNTGVFLIGCLLFFMGTVNEWAAAAGMPSAGAYMILGLVGFNFLFELGINAVLSPVIIRLINIARKKLQ